MSFELVSVIIRAHCGYWPTNKKSFPSCHNEAHIMGHIYRFWSSNIEVLWSNKLVWLLVAYNVKLSLNVVLHDVNIFVYFIVDRY